MPIASPVTVTGFVTQLKFLNGRDLRHMEQLLGFHAGRLTQGATFATLDRLPTANEFETAGYSQVAGHRHRVPSGLDPNRIKQLAMSAWSLGGPDRLIKVFATLRHDPSMADDKQYPPGHGVPQWKITRPIPGKVVATLASPAEVFRLA